MSNGEIAQISSAEDAEASYAGNVNANDWSWIGDMINSGIMTQANIQKMIADQSAHPCGLAAFMRALLGGIIKDNLDIDYAAARQPALFLPDIIGESIETRGAWGPGGKRLGSYALDSYGPVGNLIPDPDLGGLTFLGFLLGPGGPHLLYRDWIEDHMPAGGDLLAGNYSTSTTGTQVSAGIYLKNGVYRGSKVGQLIEGWRNYQINNVSNHEIGAARGELIRVVGTWRGASPVGTWTEADPILPGSVLGNTVFMEQECLRIEAESRALCEDLIIADTAMEAAALSGQLGLYTADQLARQKQSEAQERRKNLQTAGALLIGGYLALTIGR